MAITLNASQVPIPTGPVGTYSLASAYSPTGTSPQSKKFTGVSTTLSSWMNRVLTAADIGSVFACGFGIIYGLTCSAAGLLVTVTAGQANIYGVADYAGGTISIPDNTANVFVWLKSDYVSGTGTNSLTYTTSTTPPSTTGSAGQCVLLARFSTSAGVATGPDTSGVVYLSKGGLPIRYTADTVMPSDTPSSGTMFLTSCPAGTFLWDGTRYTRQEPAGVYTASATATLTSAQTMVRSIKASGAGGYTLTVSKELREWIVRNPTAGSLIISDGTLSVTVAAGKTAIVACDSTSVYRVTADA
jgi:hypothetical protein